MKLLAIGAFALASLAASGAAAQQSINHGPAISGVCVYNPDLAMGMSTAGQGLAARMRTLQEEARGELAPYQTNLQSEAQAIRQAGQAADQERVRAFEQRAREAQQLEQTRGAELEYTRRFQLNALAEALRPITIALYQEKGCALLIDGNSVLAANPAMDLTEEATRRLNAQLPQLPAFNRMAVPVQQ